MIIFKGFNQMENDSPELDSFFNDNGSENDSKKNEDVFEKGAPSPLILTSIGCSILLVSSTCKLIAN